MKPLIYIDFRIFYDFSVIFVDKLYIIMQKYWQNALTVKIKFQISNFKKNKSNQNCQQNRQLEIASTQTKPADAGLKS